MSSLAAICLFFLVINGQNHAQTKSSDKQSAHADTNSGQDPAPQIIQTNTPCCEASTQKQDQSQAESKPWLTHGEWVISVLTFIYVGVNILIWIRIGHQTDAMNAANEIGRKNLEAVQRAFVYVKENSIVAEKHPKTGETVFRFRTVWENSGTTPTRQLSMYISALWRSDELPKGYAFPNVNQIEHFLTVLGPKAIIWSNELFIPLKILQGVQQGTLHLYVYGAAIYKDVFNDNLQHVTKFCVKISASGDLSGPSGKITMTTHTEHNCADEDC
jgi:hypothetical protein